MTQGLILRCWALSRTRLLVFLPVAMLAVFGNVAQAETNVLYGQGTEGFRQWVTLTAPEGNTFTEVLFASYGLPNEFTINPACHASTSFDVVASLALGSQTFSVNVTNQQFMEDPCVGIQKRLQIVVAYAPDETTTTSSTTTTTEASTTTTSSSTTTSTSPTSTTVPETTTTSTLMPETTLPATTVPQPVVVIPPPTISTTTTTLVVPTTIQESTTSEATTSQPLPASTTTMARTKTEQRLASFRIVHSGVLLAPSQQL